MMGALYRARRSQTAGRRPQVAKPCYIGPLGIWLTIRDGPPKAPFIGELAAEGGLRG